MRSIQLLGKEEYQSYKGNIEVEHTFFTHLSGFISRKCHGCFVLELPSCEKYSSTLMQTVMVKWTVRRLRQCSGKWVSQSVFREMGETVLREMGK